MKENKLLEAENTRIRDRLENCSRINSEVRKKVKRLEVELDQYLTVHAVVSNQLGIAEKALMAIKNAPGGGPGKRIATQALSAMSNI